MSARPAVSPALERGLPAALEHERAVLGSCLADDQHLEVALTLAKETDFSTEAHRRLWRQIVTMREAGHVVDRVTVAHALHEAGKLASVGGMAAIAELEVLPHAAGIVEGYCRTLRVNAIRRMAFLEAQRLMELSLSGGDTEDIIASLQRAGEALSGQKHNTGKLLRVDQVYERDFGGDIRNFVGEAEQTAAVPIPWAEALGGLRVGELTILAARPGVGKSTAAAQIAANAARIGIAADYWSLEMKSGLIVRRQVAGLAGLSHFKMLRGYLNDQEKSVAYKTLAELSSVPLRLADNPGASVDQIRNELRQAKARFELPTLVVIDYLQLLQTSGGHTRNEEISRISRGLKRLTLEFPITILALSQLSRESEKEGNREPRLSDLRDSGSLEQDADSCVFIHRPNQDDSAKVQEVQWIVRKQRNGHTGMVPLQFIKDQMRFVEMTA